MKIVNINMQKEIVLSETIKDIFEFYIIKDEINHDI